ncbi:uncharacterized protein LOC122945532 [Bufo gargarizans]|uniref:uncharacterized protein LOC122945532 n=1 Tax=Bufo gargarizans TaxID=30331 RepID=UPI001CF1A87F|nr:uncharacterized protein LOC122945532 [Bufo gargarizans]
MDVVRKLLCLLLLSRSVSSLQLTGPSVHAARLGSDALVPCSFKVDKPPVDPNHLTIYWRFLDKEILSYHKTVRTTSSRYSLSTEALMAGNANLTISNIRIPDGGMYKCSVMYGLEKKEKELRLDGEAPPQVTITGKTVVLKEKSVLRCSVAGFYPVDLDIKWFRGSEMLRDVTTDEPWRNPDRTYNVNSTVTIIPTEEDMERIFSCRVRHFSLEEPIQVDFKLKYKEENQTVIIITCIIAVLCVIIIIAIFMWTRQYYRKVKPQLSQAVIRRLMDAGEIKYFLNLEKFKPKKIRIVWTCGVGRPKEVLQSTESWSDNPDRTYSVSSEVRIPEEYHKDPGFRVRVTWDHDSMEEAESREVSIRDSDYRWTPVVEEIQIPRLRHDTPATLQCNNSGYFPDAVTVRWRRRAGYKMYEKTENQRITPRRAADNTYNCTSSLTITPTLETHQGAEYICLVEHSTLETPIEKTTGSLQVTVKPQLSQAVIRRLMYTGEIKYLLNLEKFRPKNIRIVWTCGVGRPEEVLSSTESVSDNPDGTYSVSSEVRIPEERHKDPGFRVRVTWDHDSMEEAESRELSIRDSDYRWTPVVEEIQIPRLLHDTPATLQCNISGYFPDAVTVRWMRRAGDEMYEETENQRITSGRMTNNTYICTSNLTITPTLGAEYICLVEHSTLEKPIEKSTGRLQVTAAAQLDAFHSEAGATEDLKLDKRIRLVLNKEEMGLTVRDALVYALENLEKMGFKKFRKRLHEIEVKENYRRIPRGKLEDKDWGDVADLIREYYKDVYGVEVTLQVLDKINERQVAEELQEDLQKVDRFVRLNDLEESRCSAPKGRPMTLGLSDSGEMMCSVTLETFYPGYLHIEWKCRPETSTEVLSSQEVYRESPDGRSFSASSEVRISQDLLRCPESTVHVSWEHEYTSTKGQQTFSISDQDFLWRPAVDDIQTPQRLYHETPAVLQCHISGYYPDAVTVKWFRKNNRNLELCEESDEVSIPKIRSSKTPDNTYSCTARLTMTPTLRNHQGAEYICQVEHPSLEKAIKKSSGGIKLLAKPQPEPIVKTLLDNMSLQFSLHLKNFYPKDIKVKWHRGETQVRKGVKEGFRQRDVFTEREDFLFDVVSESRFLGLCFRDPQYKAYVTWEHETMDGPETRTLSVRDLPWKPKMSEVFVLRLRDNAKTRMQCCISGYFPDKVAVSWYKKQDGAVSAVQESKDIFTEISPEEMKNKTFGCTATLYFTPDAEKDEGSEFICRVEHLSLEHPIERSTGPLHIETSD